jgi:hypothetical protein
MSGYERIDALVEQLAVAVKLHGGEEAAEDAVCKLVQRVGKEEKKVSSTSCKRIDLTVEQEEEEEEESSPREGEVWYTFKAECKGCALLRKMAYVQSGMQVTTGLWLVGKVLVGW